MNVLDVVSNHNLAGIGQVGAEFIKDEQVKAQFLNEVCAPQSLGIRSMRLKFHQEELSTLMILKKKIMLENKQLKKDLQFARNTNAHLARDCVVEVTTARDAEIVHKCRADLLQIYMTGGGVVPIKNDLSELMEFAVNTNNRLKEQLKTALIRNVSLQNELDALKQG